MRKFRNSKWNPMCQFSYLTNCVEITVDNYCEIKNDKSCGKKEGQNWNEFKYECKLTDNKCQRRELLCKEQTNPEKCGEINQNCRAIKNQGASSLSCKSVQLDAKCKIVDGECRDGNNIEDYEQCGFTPDYAECKPTKKRCSACTSSCSNCQISNTGRTCSQISQNQCKEILIHKSCEVKTNGLCSIRSQITGKTCKFINDETICALVDSHCIYNSNTCNDNTDANKPPDEQKCSIINVNECGLIQKGCSDLNSQATCRDINSKKCFWSPDSNSCLQYTTDNYCQVNEGSCIRISGKDNSFSDNEDCFFSNKVLSGSSILECSKKDKCTGHVPGHVTDCSSYSTTSTHCTNGGDNCKKILLKNNCEVNAQGKCVHKNIPNINERDGICAFDDETEKNVCQLRPRKCEEYTINTCDGNQNCVFYPRLSHCIKTDDYCTISEGTCKEKNTPNPYKKCQLEGNLCAQTEKICNEIDTDKCNSAPRKTNSQCFYFGNRICNSIRIDEYCYVDTDGECKNLLKQLSQYEECAFNSGKTSCTKRDKECSDFNDDNCGNFTPESKLCFDFGNGCAEVDNNCQINENNECVAKGSGQCTLDNNKQKCSFRNNNNGSMLSTLKYALLLVCFFMF